MDKLSSWFCGKFLFIVKIYYFCIHCPFSIVRRSYKSQNLNKDQANHNRVNVTWCFVCCKAGELIGCNKCPAAYHQTCIPGNNKTDSSSTPSSQQQQQQQQKQQQQKISQSSITNSPNNNSASSSRNQSPSSVHSASTTASSSRSVQLASNWICEDCLYNRRPLYGDIIWAKVGSYRWWPAQIFLSRSLPERVRNARQPVCGEFSARFFGTNDFCFINLGRCFAFCDGDENHKTSQGGSAGGSSRSLEVVFNKGVEEAKLAFKEIERLKMSRVSKTAGTNKFNFTFIKTNKPVGNVMLTRVPLADLPKCECSAKSENGAPCSNDDTCLNRMLKYECHPATCPASQTCANQRFVKRIYPKQEPFFTGSRGWGLRNLVELKAGDFVNEYVGEIIDDEECKRRLEEAHDKNNMNFYFMTIRKDRCTSVLLFSL